MDSHSDLVLLLDSVLRLSARLRESFAEAREGEGLNAMEHTVLAAVAEAASPPTVPQIGRSLGHARQVIRQVAKGLAERGLLEFADNPDHKRAGLLVPTEAGRALQARANVRAEAIAAELRRSVDASQVNQALGLLGAIRADLEAHQRGRTE